MLFSSIVALLLVPTVTGELPKFSDIVPHAAGIALVEVTQVKEYDERGGDGNKGVRFKLKLIRGSGEFRDTIDVITDFGGFRPTSEVSKPSLPVRPQSLKRGKRYWVAFASNPMWLTSDFNQGVIAFWPEAEPKIAEVFDESVKKDVLRWQPQYHPDTGLIYGYTIGKGHWWARVEKDDKLIWQRQIPGTKVDDSFGWGMWDNTGNDFPSKMPPCKHLLMVPTTTELPKDNEYGLPVGPYHVNTGFDPESGKRYVSYVSLPQASSVELLHREYYPDSGKLKREARFEFLKSGGKTVGAKTENWYKMTVRTFDDATGKVTNEEMLRYDADAAADMRWVKIGK